MVERNEAIFRNKSEKPEEPFNFRRGGPKLTQLRPNYVWNKYLNVTVRGFYVCFYFTVLSRLYTHYTFDRPVQA